MWFLPVLAAAAAALGAAVLGHTTPSMAVFDLFRPLERTGTAAFSNQTVWVIGASGGIGAALVCQLAAVGTRHVVMSARNVTRLQHVAETCQIKSASKSRHLDLATTFSILPYDAFDERTAASTVVHQALASTPTHSIDILVWSAGVYQLQPALEAKADARQRFWRANYHAVVDLSQAIIQEHWSRPEKTDTTTGGKRKGHLVLLSSIMAKGPHALCSTYAATKSALQSYFQTLAIEENSWLRVQLVLPGATATDFWKNAAAEEASRDSPKDPRASHSSTESNRIQVDPSVMVTPERVARLSVQAMRPSGLWATLFFHEVWISNFDGLLYAWMSHYFPGLFLAINHVVATIRRAAFDQLRADLTTMFELGRFAAGLLLRRPTDDREL